MRVRQDPETALIRAHPLCVTRTCMYSIGGSSTLSRFTTYLVAGHSFGAICTIVLFLAFVTVTLATETKTLSAPLAVQSHGTYTSSGL